MVLVLGPVPRQQTLEEVTVIHGMYSLLFDIFDVVQCERNLINYMMRVSLSVMAWLLHCYLELVGLKHRNNPFHIGVRVHTSTLPRSAKAGASCTRMPLYDGSYAMP